jgi:hypothetical protein
MAAFSVAFDGTRVVDASVTTNWTAETATPTAETDYFYQGTGCISCQIKTAETGFYYTSASTSMTGKTWLAKVIITNKDALDGNGIVLRIGSATTAYYNYNIYSATTYPIPGGWQIVAIDPNVSQWRTGTTGSPNLGAVIYWAVRADCSATSKAPNLGIDAIDWVTNGTGLTGTGGDGASADGTFTDFVTADEGTANNRWGVVATRGGILYVTGVLTIGTATETDFTDSNRVLVFTDNRVTNGFCGVDFGLQNASSVISITNTLFNGRGTLTGSDDTRPDFTATGTSGTLALTSCTFNTFRNIDLTSTCTLTSCNFVSGLKITQSSAVLNGCVISGATTATGVAFITSNNPANISNCEFTFSAGHAIEITTAGTYSFSGNFFTGYGADGTNSAAIYNNSGGAVTLNITSGSTPTVRNGAGASTTINNAVTLTITTVNTSNAPLSGINVAIYRRSDGTAILSPTATNGSGVATTSYAYVSDTSIYVRARKATTGAKYLPVDTSGTITSSGYSVTITMQLDPNND